MKYLNATWLALLLAAMLVPGALLANDDNVHVKGHWIFEIYNADGSFDRRVEFDNALFSSGNTILINMLSRNTSANQWQIAVQSVNPGFEDPCINSAGLPFSCTLSEVATGDTFDTAGLMVGTDDQANPTKLLLSGSVTIANSVSLPKEISQVSTYLSSCSSTEMPNCGPSIGFPRLFTQKDLNVGVPVQPGQVVNITVEISFS